jgi:RecG-like helicase
MSKRLKHKLDRTFSEYIRKRWAKNDIVECVTCGRKDHYKNMHAGHFIPRQHLSTRYEEENVNPQCPKCNMFGAGEQYKHGLFIKKKYGNRRLNRLFELKSTTKKISDSEYEQLIQQYKEKIRQLEEPLRKMPQQKMPKDR